MPASESPSPPTDFFAIAANLGLLPTAELEQIRRRCEESGQSPAEFTTTSGLLDGVDVDIVETLSAPAEVIPGYRIEGLIGKGGMGVVYRAEQRNLGRTVALKTILVSRMADRGVFERFEREARTIGQLRHPNIISAHDFGRHAGRVYLAMELVDGTDLQHRIRELGRLDEQLAWGLARQTVSGLTHAAQHHVVHRDIKPANLMLVAPPEGYPLPAGMPMVKIADFGLALLESDMPVDERLTAPDATVGSPHYMAPEQLESSDVDQRADMYALGATVFHALTGQPPFSGMKLSQLIAAKMGAGAPGVETVRSDLSPETCRLVRRLLSRDRDQRPRDYTMLLAEIDAVLARCKTRSDSRGVLADGANSNLDSSSDRAAVTATMQTAGTLLESELRTTAAGDVSETPKSPSSRRNWLMGLAVLLAAGGAVGWRFVANRPSPLPIVRGERRLVGDAVPLFYGVTLDGWKPVFGNWGAAAEEAVLSGRDGVIERVLPVNSALNVSESTRPDAPPLFYRLDLIVRGSSPEAIAEVHFGLSQQNPGEPTRYVLRRDGSGLVLGTRAGDRADFVPDSRFPTRPLNPDADAAIEIERLPSGWFVDVNGVQFGALPLESHPQPRFRLSAEGEVEFADLFLQALESEALDAGG